MEKSDIYLHNFYYNWQIEDEVQFTERLKSILKESLISYNYFQKSTLKDLTYVQNWSSNTYGHSIDYVSLVDLSEVFGCSIINRDILNFISEGAFVLLKRQWIDKKLEESVDVSIFDKPPAIRRSFIKKYLATTSVESLINAGLEYVIPGEIKIKNKIPLEEICGLAFGEYFFEQRPQDLEMINNILQETNMIYLPLYKICTDISLTESINNTSKYVFQKIK